MGQVTGTTAVRVVDDNYNNVYGTGTGAGAKVSQQDVTPITGTAAAGSGVTVTIPAVANVTNRLAYLQIVMYAAAALTGGATPVVVTTTGLPNSPAFTFPTALAVGQTVEEKYEGVLPMIATGANTAVTIVCPATPNVIWRVNAAYYAV
jgi:hypothetical protein